MCIHMYIYIYIYVYTHIHMYVCMYVYMHAWQSVKSRESAAANLQRGSSIYTNPLSRVSTFRTGRQQQPNLQKSRTSPNIDHEFGPRLTVWEIPYSK